MLDWKRIRYEDGVYYESSDGRWRIENFGAREWGVQDMPSFSVYGWRYWAESKEEASLAAEVLALGLDPNDHRTRTSFTRHSIPPRGSWMNVHKWRCSCGDTSSGGLTGKQARDQAHDHRVGAFQKMIKEVEVDAA